MIPVLVVAEKNINNAAASNNKQTMLSNSVSQVIKLLRQQYPDAKCTLNFDNTLQLLVATILSAQCTDERVNQVTKNLFKKYQTLTDFANADIEQLQIDIRSTGFYKNKAKNIIAASQKISNDFNGKIPKTITELISLPGVARKTANVVLGTAYHISDGIVVDTHVARLSQRLEWTKETDPNKIEKDLIQIIPKKDWINISHLLIIHGRTVCKARKPQCNNCPIQSLCPSANKY